MRNNEHGWTVVTRLTFCALLITAVGGCAEQQPPPTAAAVGAQLSFIRDGATTREQALLPLGEPTGRFENERILTWRIQTDGKSALEVVGNERVAETGYQSANKVDFSLVLVFNGAVLARHSLVPMK